MCGRRADQRTRPLPGASVADIGLPQRGRRPARTRFAGSASSWWSWTVPEPARFRSLRSESPGYEGQDDPASADRGDEPILAADQVLALPAARPGHAGRVSRPTTTRSRFRTSTSRRSTSTTRRTSSSFRSTSRRRSARYRLADHYRRRGAYVALGGLHVTSLPDEAALHADIDLHWPRRGHVAAVPRRLQARSCRARRIDPASERSPACRRSGAI